MRICYLSYERGIELEKDQDIYYTDINDIEKRGYHAVIEEIVKFNPDYVIEREFNDGKALYMVLLHMIKDRLPTVVRAKWFIDTHVALSLHKMYARYIDVGFFAISQAAESFVAALGKKNTFWLPLCYPYHSQTIQPNYQPIKYPVSFVGRWGQWFPQRTEYISKLKERYGNDFHAVTDYNRMMSIIKKSKVSFNCSIADDLNFRVFEVLGAGTELVTNSVTDLYKIRGLKERLHVYGDFDDLTGWIDRLTSDDPATTHNTLKNQEWIKEHHTLYNRHKEMLQMLQGRRQVNYG